MGILNGFSHTSHSLWSIILSGGEGERMRPFIENWLGQHIPKQYCTFVGNRSMLQHTWDRADRLTASKQKITVMSQRHRPVLWNNSRAHSVGQILFQPKNCDTAAGVFLPLTYIHARNPESTVIIYPSDHFVYPENLFMQYVNAAVQATENWNDRIVILGAQPDKWEPEYGWIERGYRLGWSNGKDLFSVKSFEEKPASKQQWTGPASRYLWNTLVLVAKSQTLWTAGWQCFPKLMERFVRLNESIGTAKEGATLTALYEDIPNHNISSDLLERTVDQLAVIPIHNVRWSDWGRPERIVESLKAIGKQPIFPIDSLITHDPIGQYHQDHKNGKQHFTTLAGVGRGMQNDSRSPDKHGDD